MRIENDNKGFTMAELLIVVAIVAVLVAIAIPVFTSQLAAAKAATDEANIRSGYAQAQSFVTTGRDSQGQIITAKPYALYVLCKDGSIRLASDPNYDPYQLQGSSSDLSSIPEWMGAWNQDAPSWGGADQKNYYFVFQQVNGSLQFTAVSAANWRF